MEEKKNDEEKLDIFIDKSIQKPIIDLDSLIKNSKTRVLRTLEQKSGATISFKEGKNISKQFVESKIKLVILNIDLVDSTRMSMALPIDKFTTMIRVFVQEISLIIKMYDGYILKYVGDAVLGFFSSDNNYGIKSNDSNKVDLNRYAYNHQCNIAILCAHTMIEVISYGINPILREYGYPEIKVKIGIDFGEVSVVQYGLEIEQVNEDIEFRKPYIDLIGPTISIAVKMTNLAKPNHVVIGQCLYDNLNTKQKILFKRLYTNPDIWNYTREFGKQIYHVYVSK